MVKNKAQFSLPLFTLILNPWLRWVEEQDHGFAVSNSVKVGASAIADDVATLDGTDAGIIALWKGFEDFCDFADLQPNVDKTKLMANAARRASDVPLPVICFKGTPIEWLDVDAHYVYLGHLLKANLDWREHEDRLIDMIKKKCGIIASLKSLSVSEKARLVSPIVSGILGYSSRTLLLSQECLEKADAVTADAIRRSMRDANTCNPMQSLELFGIPSAQYDMPARHLIAVAHSTLARKDRFSTKMELKLTKVAKTWDDDQFHIAKESLDNRRRKDGHIWLKKRLGNLSTLHNGIVPAHELANAFGLTLLLGGRRSNLKANGAFPLATLTGSLSPTRFSTTTWSVH